MRFDDANALQRGLRQVAGTRALAWFFARVLHHLDLPVLRWTKGRRSFTAALTGLPVVELTTIGARSGRQRTLPIVGVPDGDRLVLIASNFGQARHPGWYYNLKASPRCRIVFRGEQQAMEAYEAAGEERQRLWDLDLTVYPARARYARRARNRVIPVMVLRPVTPATERRANAATP